MVMPLFGPLGKGGSQVVVLPSGIHVIYDYNGRPSFVDPRTGQKYDTETQAITAYEQSDAGTKAKRTGELGELEKEYDTIPDTLRSQYEHDARRAGTFAETPQFRSGLESEVGAGARGARVANVARQNALRKLLGMPELPSPNGQPKAPVNPPIPGAPGDETDSAEKLKAPTLEPGQVKLLDEGPKNAISSLAEAVPTEAPKKKNILADNRARLKALLSANAS